MWIIIPRKLPVEYAPPRLSIFWSTPWPGEGKFVQKMRAAGIGVADSYADTDDDAGFGHTPNWVGARKIAYLGEDIRVFPHEFNPLPAERMQEYVLGGAYVLMPDSIAGDALVKGVLDGETRPIYEQAQIDGCSREQAFAVALGHDITLPDAEFAPLGWYKLRREYAAFFCSEEELEADFPAHPTLIAAA